MDQIKHHSGERETRRVGACELTLDQEAGEYITMSLSYSDDLLLTPNYQDACVLFQVLKFTLIDKRPVSDYHDFHEAIRSSGASCWWPLRPLFRHRETTPFSFHLASGPISYFANPTRLSELYRDICSATQSLGLDPQTYFAPISENQNPKQKPKTRKVHTGCTQPVNAVRKKQSRTKH